MDEKKSFFASLEPRSALIVGALTGILTLCTIGFFVMLGVFLSGRAGAKTEAVLGVDSQLEAALANVPKADKPSLELFVMSYCPFGLQTQKALLPVMELLQNKADIAVRFVSYAMHGQKELEENSRQYCLQKEQPDKYVNYLKCFTTKDDYRACARESGVNEAKMSACVSAADKQFGVTAKYNDQKTWLSGRYPLYPTQADLNDKYGVGGSPTVVVNGVNFCSQEDDLSQCQARGARCVLYPVGRSPEAVKKVICAAFNNPPAECQQTLSSQSPAPGFGGGTGDAATDAACGS